MSQGETKEDGKVVQLSKAQYEALTAEATALLNREGVQEIFTTMVTARRLYALSYGALQGHLLAVGASPELDQFMVGAARETSESRFTVEKVLFDMVDTVLRWTLHHMIAVNQAHAENPQEDKPNEDDK